MSSLRWLWLNDNQLSGPIPVELTTAPRLQDLVLDNNQLTGPIPAGLVDQNLRTLYLGGNSGLTGCIPAGLRDDLDDAARLTLSDCTTTTTYLLTTSAGAGGRTSPLPGTYRYLSGASVTVTATPDAYYNLTGWGDDCSGTATTCTLTMDAAKTASATFQIQTYTLTVTATGGGSVDPSGTSTENGGTELTLTASWDDATHTFTGWGGDCSGSETTCALLMDAAKTMTATFEALPADRCATTTAADCIRAVYKGAPGDYVQVQDIPADRLLTPGSDGRYQVERGQQITVVTAAPLPTGYPRFYLQRRAAQGVSPTSYMRLIPPVGTTYTFTVTTDESAPTLISFDLRAARPRPLPRPGQKPELGNRVVTTTFQVQTTTMAYTSYDTTGEATTRGSYAFLTDPNDLTTAVTTYEGLRDRTTTGVRIHTSDAYGASQADTYADVAVGDVVEWRKSQDCWIRYLVTSAPAPAAGATTREFGVKWVTYTYTDCSGDIPANAAVKVGWDPPSLAWRDVTSPVWHGPFILTPRDRSGPRAVPPATYPGPTASGEVTGEQGGPWPSTDPAVVRTHPLWRDPDLPDGWVLGFLGATADLVEARYGDGEGYFALEIYVVEWYGRWIPRRALADVTQVGLVDGNPAVVEAHGSIVTIFDESTGVKYIVYAHDPSIRENAEAVIAIARSLLPEQGGS